MITGIDMKALLTRYRHDPFFATLVTSLESQIYISRYDVEDVVAAAYLACLRSRGLTMKEIEGGMTSIREREKEIEDGTRKKLERNKDVLL